MKLLFEKEKQRELLNKEKKLNNSSWPKFAKQLKIKEGKLRSFYYDNILIDEDLFDKLKLREDYKKFIIKKFNNNWGQVKGGKISKGNLKEINIPKRNKELAEFWGLMLGDGNVQKIKDYKIGVYNVNVTGHSNLDKNYIINFVKPLGEKLFNVNGKISYSKFNNAIRLSFYGRKIVDFFEENNFKSGNKIKNQLKIPEWIKENNLYLSSCLRGLFDTDGTFYKLKDQNSHQIGFTNHNIKLLNEVRDSLINLGIGVSKIINNRKIVITKKSEIAKFYKLIGFHNSKHLVKINAYFKAL